MWWLLFLLLFVLSGISTIVFIILLALKKKRAVLGLSISGGIVLLSLAGFVITGSIAAFNAFSETTTDSYYYEDEEFDAEEDFWDEEDEAGFWDEAEEVNVEEEDAEAQADTKKDEKAKENSNADDTYSAGSYKVGADLPAGEYLVIGKEFGFIEASKDSTGDMDSIIFNDLVDEGQHTYVTLKKDEYFKLKNADMFPVDKAPSVKPKDNIYRTGMYKVGKDIPAGEYKVHFDKKNSVTDTGYVEVSEDSRHDLKNVVHNDLIETDAYVTLKKDQYITLRDVYIDTSK